MEKKYNFVKYFSNFFSVDDAEKITKAKTGKIKEDIIISNIYSLKKNYKLKFSYASYYFYIILTKKKKKIIKQQDYLLLFT